MTNFPIANTGSHSFAVAGHSPRPDEPIFLVFKHEKDKNENSLVSEGPFKEIEKAEHLMRSLLVEGVCAWMVSYNGREG